jgi:hypothetical protein
MRAYARTHTGPAVIGIGIAFALVGPWWMGRAGDGLGGSVFLLALEALPILTLAAASDEMPWWVALGAAGACGVWTAAGVRSIYWSSSSTASLAIPFIPLVALFAVPCLVSACDIVALVQRRARGGAVEPPRRGEIVLGLVLGGSGLLAFSAVGLIFGLAVALAVWAHRVRPAPLGRT